MTLAQYFANCERRVVSWLQAGLRAGVRVGPLHAALRGPPLTMHRSSSAPNGCRPLLRTDRYKHFPVVRAVNPDTGSVYCLWDDEVGGAAGEAAQLHAEARPASVPGARSRHWMPGTAPLPAGWLTSLTAHASAHPHLPPSGRDHAAREL